MSGPARCSRTTCPSPVAHDTETAYRQGCASEAAHADALRTAKARRTGRHQSPIHDNTGTVRRLQALGAIGWSGFELGPRLGLDRKSLDQLRSGRYRTHRRNAEKVAALYDELSMIPGPSSRCAAGARTRGWAPPLAWDNIDDLDEVPAALPPLPRRGRPAVPLAVRLAERRAEIERLSALGRSAAEVAEALGVHKRTVERARGRMTS